MNIPAEFDEIRPYTPEELPKIYEELIADPDFQNVISHAMPQIPFEVFAAKMRSCKTNMEFQKTFCYDFLWDIAQKHSDGLTMDCSSLVDKKQSYTFISNHRDIILDSGFLSILLVDNDMNTVEIAIGDNLLIYPWIKKLVRVNKSFIVQRALTMRQMLEASARMSRYMHFAIAEKHESIWIAQREGRAKDSNDRTQDSVLKMMAMGGEGDLIERLLSLNITPVAISYEYDPCDFLKAREFQMKRDTPDFKKTTQDDLNNMQTGLFGYKGHIHFQVAPCINTMLETLNRTLPKQELFTHISAFIDKSIHTHYRFYPGNYVAYDLWKGEQRFSSHYTEKDKETFETYLTGQLNKIDLPHKDIPFLRDKLLAMYANPLINYLNATSL